MRRLIQVLLAAACCIGIATASAQDYPVKPLRIQIAYGPGSGLDLLTRQTAQEMSATWKQPVIVENRPGANGLLGAEACRKAAPDGYTVCMLTKDLFWFRFWMNNVGVDPVKDFQPVTNLLYLVSAVVVHPSTGAASVREFVDAAKARPGTFNYGSLGNGSGMNIFFEWMKKQYGIDVVHVPYKTPVDLVQANVTGQSSVTLLGALNFLPQIRAGKVRAIAVSVRTPLLPDVPTLAEQGIALDVSTWFGYFTPVGVPPDIIRRLRDETARIYAVPAFRQKNLIDQGLLPVNNTPEEFARAIQADIATGADMIRISGVRQE